MVPSSVKEVGIDLAPYKNLEAWAAKCIALVPNYQKAGAYLNIKLKNNTSQKNHN